MRIGSKRMADVQRTSSLPRRCNKRRKDGSLQRSTIGSAPALAPPAVHEVIASPGQPMDAKTLQFMESRLGHDFSRVRVHTGRKAAESAHAVNALAYTVGRDVVFADGKYSPASINGIRLLAHELSHVIQQSNGETVPQRGVEIVDDRRLEDSAKGAARAIIQGSDHGSVERGIVRPSLQRDDGTIDVELVPTPKEEAERLKEMGIDLPEVSEETWRAIGGVSDNAGKTLSEQEKKRISKLVKEAIPSGPLVAFAEGPRFVLHDTASLVSSKRLEELKKLGRGPLGEAAAAYVPVSGEATIARPVFFEEKRPTASEYEKASEIISQTEREKAFREVWQATKPSERQPALDRALAGLGLTEKEIKKEQKEAKSQLNASSGKIFTTASWAVGEICKNVASKGAPAMAASSKTEAQLTGACATLKPYYQARRSRVSSEVNIEIIQQAGSDCRTTGKILPLPKPAYSEDQYKSLVKLYLRAALQAGRYPEITTHFWVDRDVRGHCDPRCFDLMHLYDLIAAALGHGKGSTYGLKPIYGTKWGSANIWWNDTACGGTHP